VKRTATKHAVVQHRVRGRVSRPLQVVVPRRGRIADKKTRPERLFQRSGRVKTHAQKSMNAPPGFHTRRVKPTLRFFIEARPGSEKYRGRSEHNGSGVSTAHLLSLGSEIIVHASIQTICSGTVGGNPSPCGVGMHCREVGCIRKGSPAAWN
jgi:hypothetical protein